MYLISLNISWQTLNSETFIIDERCKKLYKLEETTNDIWQLLLDKKNFEEICFYILSVYDVEIEKVKKDVKKTIDNFLKLEFIEET